jgi:hypothetical protein
MYLGLWIEIWYTIGIYQKQRNHSIHPPTTKNDQPNPIKPAINGCGTAPGNLVSLNKKGKYLYM